MAIMKAKEDWYHFERNGFLPVITRRNAKVEPRTVEEVVSICLSNKNRKMLAHGTKKFTTQDGETLMLPKIRRTKSRGAIWEAYRAYKKLKSDVPAMGRTSVMGMLAYLTGGQQQLKRCVDYCLGVLLFDNFRNIQYMVDKRVEDVRVQKLLRNQLTAVSNFLKFGYPSHIDKDGDPAHDS